jgi:hypothetical protein
MEPQMKLPMLPLTRTAVVSLLVLGLGARPAAAQVTVGKVSTKDSVSWITRRTPLEESVAMVRTRERDVAVLLMDSTVVLQFTDAGLRRVKDGTDSSQRHDGLVARMLGAAVAELLDHGIAYRLSALRGARAEGSRLVLEDREGHRVFEDVEVNGHHPMEEFDPRELDRFAATLDRAIRQRR